jgi:hypothetical protein
LEQRDVSVLKLLYLVRYIDPDLWYLDIIYPVTIFDAAAMILDDISFLEKAVALD